MSKTKKKYGQFYTTNYKYILKNFNVPENVKTIIEPFAGECDLLNFLVRDNYNITCFDIDPKKEFIIKRDTLLNPPNYDDTFVLTNPPFLARNKSSDKTIYDMYKLNDLYKCFIKSLINNNLIGGIIIVPLNFLCSIRKNDINLRKQFIEKYNITIINIFEEKVFDDTSYTVCSFQFEIKDLLSDSKEIECYIYPSNKKITFRLTELNNYMIGGEVYNLPLSSKYKVSRATKLNETSEYITNLQVQCLDNSIDDQIKITTQSNETRFIDKTLKLSARSYITLIIEPKLNIDEQKKLKKLFNDFINENRIKYNSLFLTNYRESNSLARKRISFTLIFRIINYLLHTNF